jgi:bifunctional non-homologous end joining protein LigD
MPTKGRARFIEPMLLLRTDKLPDDSTRWIYQLKVDGYRAVAFRTGGKLHLRSRNDNDFSTRYAPIMKGLAKLPDETIVDGKVVALDDEGRPSFNLLQNAAGSSTLIYYVFDVMMLDGRDVTREPLDVRLELLEKKVIPRLSDPVRYMGNLNADLPSLIHAVKTQGLEGLVAKRRDSRYEPGLRSDAC